MQSDDKTQNIFPFLVILSFVLGTLVTSSGSTYGQLKTLQELAKHTPNQNAAITVGKSPTAIGIDPVHGKVYVANSGDNTVSVISSLNSSKIGSIKVGSNPHAIGVDSDNRKVYVANSGDNTVSVISTLNSSKIGSIKVGSNPHAIGVDSSHGEVYVS